MSASTLLFTIPLWSVHSGDKGFPRPLVRPTQICFGDSVQQTPENDTLKNDANWVKLKTDTFSPSQTASLHPDQLLQAKGLTSLEATSPEDVSQAAKLYAQTLSDGDIEVMRLTMNRRSDRELKNLVRHLGIVPPQLPDIFLSPFLDQIKAPLKDPQQYQQIMRSELLSERQNTISMKQRFVDNPQGALIVLKDPKTNQVIAMQGINQFQATEDFQILQQIMKPLVSDLNQPPHALITKSYIHPEYKSPELETALHQKALEHAKTMGYRYVHWPVPKSEKGSLNPLAKALGYQPLKPNTILKDAPKLDAIQIKKLIAEYNSHLQELHCKDILERNPAKLLK